jgi:sugar-specific transcriptional regulator TrmB
MTNITDQLKNIGLKKQEIDIYLAILALGSGTISDISKKAKIKRPTVYQYMDNIVGSGLVYKTLKGKRVFYRAANPKKIVKSLEEKKENIEKIMPELQSMYSNVFYKPKISFYEGKEGLKNIYEQMIFTHKNVYSIFSPENFFNIFSFEENDKFLMGLYNAGGKLYNLVEKSDRAIEHLKVKKYKDFVKNRLLPDDFKYQTDLLIKGDCVALISFANLVGVVIEDKAIADLQRSLFKFIWDKM